MLFSIVIPTYNRAKLIATTLYSVLSQTYANFEIIVVDDGSTDNTSHIVDAIKDKRIVYYKKNNEERSAARNYGTVRSKGDYITFLDSDDILCPNFLNEALKMIEQEKKPAWFHVRYVIKDSETGSIIIDEKKIYTNNKDLNRRLFYEGNFISCIGVFLRKDIAHINLFEFDKRLTTSEDHELWLRIAAKYPLKINKVVCANLIQHDSRSISTMNKDILINGKKLALHLTLSNRTNDIYTRGHEGKIKSSSYSYISLHLALTGKHKGETIIYLLKATKHHFFYLFTRRFLATIKHLIFTY
jgi:glycosyltransferase involved in cell wall biosynthesis